MSVELRGSRPVGASGTRREQCTRCRRQPQAAGLSRVNVMPAGSSPRCIASSHRNSASVCRAVRHVDAEALWPSIDDSGDDAFPRTRAVQQTLLRSFVISGIGLHTAEMANVRVRPAFANEGRYFVIVPEGTIGLDTDYAKKGQGGITYEEGTALFQAKQLELFQKFLREEEAGYSRGFEAFCNQEGHPELVPGYDAEGELPGRAQGGPEAPQAAADGEVVIAATAEAGVSEHGLLTSLQDTSGAARIHAVQHLLGVLEACGVDNCRIEIEGGTELPVLDGSGLQWWRGVVGAGVVPAADAASGESVPKLVWRPTQLVTVSGRSHAFATLYPEPDVSRLTYGLNHSVEAPIIGKPWMSWCVQEDGSIGPGVVAARAYAPSVDHLYQLRDAGFLQAGTVGRTVVADGEDWLNEGDVRFHDDEPVRHRLLNLLGDLALLNRRGNGGVPLGHVVVHDADHQVHLQFCKALLGALTDDDLVPFPEPPQQPQQQPQPQQQQ